MLAYLRVSLSFRAGVLVFKVKSAFYLGHKNKLYAPYLSLCFSSNKSTVVPATILSSNGFFIS
jgi:hypothetical protein